MHNSLEAAAARARITVVQMASRGGCFVGSAFSCLDIILFLYTHVLRRGLGGSGRDRFILSKGHAVPALYAVLVELGLLPSERLSNHLSPRDIVYWHPHPAMPGVDFHSGSLGHGLGVAVGMALDAALSASDSRVFVVMGDGELNEGSVWEALLVAASQALDKLVIIVDRNRRQANFPTEELTPLEPLVEKFRAFNCAVREVDAHDFAALGEVFSSLPFQPGVPSVVLANSTRGKGLPRIEDDPEQWFVQLTPAERDRWIAELE